MSCMHCAQRANGHTKDRHQIMFYYHAQSRRLYTTVPFLRLSVFHLRQPFYFNTKHETKTHTPFTRGSERHLRMYVPSDNLIVQLSSIVQMCKKVNEQCKCKDQDTRQFIENVQVSIHDIETSLCKFMSSMISSPMTGRLYLSNPVEYVPEDTRTQSLTRQLHIVD